MKIYNNFKDSNSTFNETIEAMTKVAIDYNKAKKYQKNSHNPSKTDLRYGKNKLGVSSDIRNSLLEKWKKLASNLQEGYLQYISSEPSLKTIENLKKLKKGEFNKMNKDSIDFDYDFYQVMDAAYEGEFNKMNKDSRRKFLEDKKDYILDQLRSYETEDWEYWEPNDGEGPFADIEQAYEYVKPFNLRVEEWKHGSYCIIGRKQDLIRMMNKYYNSDQIDYIRSRYS